MAEIDYQYVAPVCNDCLIAYHNGEMPERGWLENILPDPLCALLPGEIMGTCEDDCESGYFSRALCETCHTSLGGSRHDVTITKFKE